MLDCDVTTKSGTRSVLLCSLNYLERKVPIPAGPIFYSKNQNYFFVLVHVCTRSHLCWEVGIVDCECRGGEMTLAFPSALRTGCCAPFWPALEFIIILCSILIQYFSWPLQLFFIIKMQTTYNSGIDPSWACVV